MDAQHLSWQCSSCYAERTEADAARQVGIVKKTRTAAEAAYRSLVDAVNAMIERQKAISVPAGEEECACRVVIHTTYYIIQEKPLQIHRGL